MASLQAQFAAALHQIQSNPFFANELKRYGLQNFKFEILSERHKQAVIASIGAQLSKEGGNSASVAYNVSGAEKVNHVRWVHVIEHAIRAGLSYVVLDEQGEIAVGILNSDCCDKHGRIDYSAFPVKYTKRGEFTGNAMSKHPFYVSLQDNIRRGRIQKGECIECEVGWVRRDLQRRPGVHLLFGQVAGHLLFHSLKPVKYLLQNCTHPGTVKTLYKMDRYFNMRCGGNEALIQSCITDSRQFFVDKFQKDEWYRRNLDQRWIMQNLNKLYNGCQVLHYGKLRQQYSSQQYFNHLLNAYRTKCKL